MVSNLSLLQCRYSCSCLRVKSTHVQCLSHLATIRPRLGPFDRSSLTDETQSLTQQFNHLSLNESIDTMLEHVSANQGLHNKRYPHSNRNLTLNKLCACALWFRDFRVNSTGSRNASLFSPEVTVQLHPWCHTTVRDRYPVTVNYSLRPFVLFTFCPVLASLVDDDVS